jgi:hypothetical protein
MSDTKPKRKIICPMMGVVLRNIGDGYHPTVRWEPVECRRKGCAVWTDYGCGLSHNITIHAPSEVLR